MEKPAQPLPLLNHPKSSLSESFRKFTNDTFTRRPPATSTSTSQLPRSTSLASVSVTQNQQSRLPTPSGIPRSTSFFGGLNHTPRARRRDGPVARETTDVALGSKAGGFHVTGRREYPHPATGISSVSHGLRDTSIAIEQRRLMQPMLPPLPLSTSSGNLNAAVQIVHHHHHHRHHHHPSSAWPVTDGCSGNNSSSSSENRQRRITISQPERLPTKTLIPSREHIKTPIPSKKTARYRRNTQAVLPPSPPPSGPGGGGRLGQVGTVKHISRFSEGFEREESSPQVRQQDNQKIHQGEKEKVDSGHGVGAEARNITDQLQIITDDARKPLSSCPSLEAVEKPSVAGGGGETRTEPPDLSLIYTSQSAIYWLGRHTALSDRFRSAALPSIDPPPLSDSPATSPTPNFSHPVAAAPHSQTVLSFRHDPMHDSPQRNRRVFVHLRTLCATEEASQSLDDFRKQWEKRFPNGEDAGDGKERGKARKISKSGMGPQSKLVREKKSWLEGLIGGVGRRFS